MVLSLDDQTMYDMLGWLAEEEEYRLDHPPWPGMAGPAAGLRQRGISADTASPRSRCRMTTHLVWATGGGMVPEEEMAQYLAKGR